MKFLSLVLVGLLAFASMDADAARRLGSGSSSGKQSNNVTQREAAKPPAAPGNANQATNQGAAAAKPGAPAAAPAGRPWGAMLGGLAAGLGLAWLARSLGLGEAFGQFILIALMVLVAFVAIGFIVRAMKARNGQAAGGGGGSPLAYQGAGSASNAATPTPYSTNNVGNDASARPWERNSMAFEAGKPLDNRPAAGGVQIGSALIGSGVGSGVGGALNWAVPEGFDSEGFLNAAKRNFVSLQDAWDRSDFSLLRSMMTDEMVAEIRAQIVERDNQSNGIVNKTEVVMLDAQLLGIEDLGADYMASVEFSGMIREEPSSGPSPFREVWNMTKPKSGNIGWVVAGVQALQ